MKKTKTKSLLIGKFALVACMSLIGYTSVSASTIETVDVVSGKELRVTLTGATLTTSEITGDVKTLKDIAVEGALKSLDSDKVINITLAEDLFPNSSYSLLSIYGAEGNIEFTLGEKMENVEFINAEVSSQIEKIVVKDSKNIDVYYKLGLASTEFEYKILSNTVVETMKVEDGVLVLSLKNDLVSNSNYILMVLSLKDELWNPIALDDGLKDFSTGVIVPTVEAVVTESGSTMSGATLPEEAAVTEELNAATEEVKTNVEEVALKAETTPDAGAETWVLLLATFLFNNVYFIVKRRRQKMA